MNYPPSDQELGWSDWEWSVEYSQYYRRRRGPTGEWQIQYESELQNAASAQRLESVATSLVAIRRLTLNNIVNHVLQAKCQQILCKLVNRMELSRAVRTMKLLELDLNTHIIVKLML